MGEVKLAESDAEIARCFPVMAHLRPHLAAEEFVERVRAQQAQGYWLAYLEDEGGVVAVAGFRVMEKLSTGRTMYVDDLVTHMERRSRGYGKTCLTGCRSTRARLSARRSVWTRVRSGRRPMPFISANGCGYGASTL